MGISGLYKWLDSIKRSEHVKKYAGKTLGVDTYSWLHKGAFSCAIELVKGMPTTKYVDYCVERVKMLQHHGITPYLVFDGDYLPSKASTEEGRETRREESRQKGLALLDTNKGAAIDILQKAIDVTPLMARHVIEACKALDIPYVVAPYEADAQLYYLEKTGVIDGVISEDSDLLVFGVRLLVTKMDRFGDCVEVNRDDFTRCKNISLAGWTNTEFRTMAILSGCDYLPSIKGIGVKKAHSYVRSHKTAEKIVRSIRLDGKMSVPVDYLEKFKQAELTFLHQRVWCPKADRMVMCTEPAEPLTGEALVFIGGEVEIEIARGVARGDLDPMTKSPFDLSHMPKHVPKPASSTPSTSNLNKKFPLRPTEAGVKPKKSIASFFGPPVVATPPPRTPLQAKSANVQIIRKAFSAPRLVSASTPLTKKRINTEETPKTDVPLKKPRLYGPDENVKATGERSSFFQTPNHVQSRRPLGDVSNLSPLPVDSIKRPFSTAAKLPPVTPTPTLKKELADLERAIKASLDPINAAEPPKEKAPASEKELSDLELAIKASLSSEYLPGDHIPDMGDDDTSVQKVARSLKADFVFKASPPGAAPKKLAKFVERQRAGVIMKTSAGGRAQSRTNFLQQFRNSGGSATNKTVGKTAQIPHTVNTDENSSGESQENGPDDSQDWPNFVGPGESQGSSSTSQSQSQKILGDSGFSKFMLRR